MSRTFSSRTTAGLKPTTILQGAATVAGIGHVAVAGQPAFYATAQLLDAGVIDLRWLSRAGPELERREGGIVRYRGLANPHASIPSLEAGVPAAAAPAAYVGVEAAQPGSIHNTATIVGGYTGVSFSAGGTVINGATSDATAVITADFFGVSIMGAGTVANFGTITGSHRASPRGTVPLPHDDSGILPHPAFGGYGVDLQTGGGVTNGSNADTGAYVYGGFIGVKGHGANITVHNYGTIVGGVAGIYDYLAGLVTNGSNADTTALISGGQLGFRNTAPGQTILNYGTITSSAGSGINITAGGKAAPAGTVVNGSVTDTVATASGYVNGFTSVSDGILHNYGTVTGKTGVGALVGAGGTLTNGSAADTHALITGRLIGAEINGTYLRGKRPITNSLSNDGTIIGSQIGAELSTGGVLVNGAANVTSALIKGGSGAGVETNGAVATVVNDGRIISVGSYGVSLAGACSVTNGATNVIHALISGTSGVVDAGGFTTVSNDGTILATTGAGVALYGSGVVINGSATTRTASIAGASYGVVTRGNGETSKPGTVTNFGVITASASTPGGYAAAVDVANGGRVTNGSAGDTTAAISGGNTGVKIVRGGTVVNYGMVQGTAGAGISLVTGGAVTNGSTADTAASVTGDTYGVAIDGGKATLANDGTIAGTAGPGVYTGCGGAILNGAIDAEAALISGGSFGVKVSGGATTLTNDGTITASGGIGVYAKLGGLIVNGEPGVTGALISGVSYGIEAMGASASTVTNKGTILASRGIGLSAGERSVVTNGSAIDVGALIKGATYGVEETGPSSVLRTLTNFGTIVGATGIYFSAQARATVLNAGTIIGTGGTALQFGVNADRLILDPGAAFQGEVDGGGVDNNTVELAAGTFAGSIGGFGQAIGNGIENFAVVTVDDTADWVLTGANTITTLDNDGVLQVGNGGSLDVSAAVGSTSTGTFEIRDDATMRVRAMTGSGAAIRFLGADSSRLVVALASSFGTQLGGPGYTGPVLQDFGTAASVDFAGLPYLSGAVGLEYNSSTGLLQVTDKVDAKLATLSFDPATLGAGSFHAGDDGSGFLLITHT